MSEKRDYYEVLGIAQEASADEVRRAYRQLALKFHPDRNPGNAEAEASFKEATEAYSVLSDATKRTHYDRFGHSDTGGFDFANAGMGDILSQFQDMFSDFFGFGGFGNTSRRRGPERGQDVRIEAAISLKDAMAGCKRDVAVRGAAPCGTCSGTGAKPGTQPKTCSQCNGSGQMTTQRGFIMFSTTCPQCRGTGQFIEERCESCSGAGVEEQQRKVVVTFPAGIDAGQRLRVPGQGMPGAPGAPPGDLYVDVELEPDERFERHGTDLGVRYPLSFSDAALGCAIEVELPDGSSASAKVKPGTQPGTVIKVRERGMPRLDRTGRGDLHIMVEVRVPKRLTKRAKKLLAELEEELGDRPKVHASSA